MRIFSSLFFALAFFPLSAAEREPIRVLLITPVHESVLAGAKFGAEEAQMTARLLDREFVLIVKTTVDPDEAAALAKNTRNVDAIAGGITREMSDAIAKAARVPFLEIRAITDAAGSSDDGRFRLTPPASGALTWHHELERFGAGELNQRFKRSTGRNMDSEAYTAWLAMKIVVESELRTRPIEEIRIDGHKGVLLKFDDKRVLQQPVYLND
ncbi:MAG TPA: hypothetical protein VF057_08605 [Thermoanaerobaculia bacterium]